VFKGTPFEHGAEIGKYDIDNLIDPRKRNALLHWWDDEYAAMERRGVETGYRQAIKEGEAGCAIFIDKECEMIDVQATTIAGVLVKLETALNTVCPEGREEEATYSAMAWNALGDLKWLAVVRS